jgi:hypothetical protein
MSRRLGLVGRPPTVDLVGLLFQFTGGHGTQSVSTSESPHRLLERGAPFTGYAPGLAQDRHMCSTCSLVLVRGWLSNVYKSATKSQGRPAARSMQGGLEQQIRFVRPVLSILCVSQAVVENTWSARIPQTPMQCLFPLRFLSGSLPEIAKEVLLALIGHP